MSGMASAARGYNAPRENDKGAVGRSDSLPSEVALPTFSVPDTAAGRTILSLPQSGKWQATELRPSGRGAGSSRAQRSVAFGQRVRKRQPEGRLPGSGG